MTLSALATIAATGLSIAFLHAAIPTHWLPFVLTSRALKWSRSKTLFITMIAGVGHAVCTSILGFLLAWFGIAMLNRYGVWFPRVAGGALLLLGLFYLYRQLSGGAGHFHLFGGHAHGHSPAAKGPHGGFQVENHGTMLELTVHHEAGVARFRVYQASTAGTALPAAEADSVFLTTTRTDQTRQAFTFISRGLYLESVEPVAAPHAFSTIIGIGHQDHAHEYTFTFSGRDPFDHTDTRDPASAKSDWAAIVSLWMLLTFSPCEGFLVVYVSGVKYGWKGFLVLTGMLGIGTVGAMMLFTSVALYGARKIKVNALERYESGILGSLLSALGLFVIFFDT